MSQDCHRREFARRLTFAAAGAIPLAGSAAIVAAEPDEPADKKTAKPAELLLELVKQSYPKHLEEEQLALIRKDLDGIVARSKALSSFPLVNADEPAFVFAAFRGEGG